MYEAGPWSKREKAYIHTVQCENQHTVAIGGILVIIMSPTKLYAKHDILNNRTEANFSFFTRCSERCRRLYASPIKLTFAVIPVVTPWEAYLVHLLFDPATSVGLFHLCIVPLLALLNPTATVHSAHALQTLVMVFAHFNSQLFLRLSKRCVKNQFVFGSLVTS